MFFLFSLTYLEYLITAKVNIFFQFVSLAIYRLSVCLCVVTSELVSVLAQGFLCTLVVA